MGARGVLVRVREDGSRMASNTKTCSIDSSLRDTSIAHGFMVGMNQERLRIPHEVCATGDRAVLRSSMVQGVLTSPTS